MRPAGKVGDPDDPDLSESGRAWAKALVDWVPKTFAKPDLIFATAESRHSERPIETLTPLAESLDVEVDARFADQDYGSLAKARPATTRSCAAGWPRGPCERSA